jgi:serine/threonine protein kinase
VLAYEAVTGRRPFARPPAAQTMTATIEAEPQPVNALNREVPPHLALVIHRCLEKNPANRYESTRDLARGLQHVVTGPPAVTPSVRRRLSRAEKIVAAAILLSAIAVGSWMWLRRESPATSAPAPVVAVRPFRNLSHPYGRVAIQPRTATLPPLFRAPNRQRPSTDLAVSHGPQVLRHPFI